MTDITGLLMLAFLVWGWYSEKKNELIELEKKGANNETI